MRAAAAITAALLLSGCSWVRHELPWTAPPEPPVAPAPVPIPKPEPPRPARPRPHVEHVPPPEQSQSQPQAEPSAAPVDYEARCRAMAANRADDAKQLGASQADQAKMQSDTYRDCIAGSGK
jgi:outer membrane biosynthesis protein TonB